MAKNKLKVKLTVPFAGSVGGVDSPPAGTIVEMPADVAKGMVKENTAELAEKDDDEDEDKPKRKIGQRGGAQAEEAREEAPEKRGK